MGASTTAASFTSLMLDTVRDVVPIILVLGFFQFVVIRRPVPNLSRVLAGLAFVVVGLALFLVGLENALFPLGRSMATQLSDPTFVGASGEPGDAVEWWRYYWVILFGAAIGFAATIAEPSLIAVSLKAQDVSGGAVRAWPLRLAVALGVGLSIAFSTFRIVTGAPLVLFMVVGYAIVLVQTLLAPRSIVPLAYDSGGVTTSTVTVPLVTAHGLGLAAAVPGRDVLADGFGVIALAAMFPLITVMGYAQLSQIRAHRSRRRR